MPSDETTIRDRLRHILHELRHVPAISATSVTREYVRQFGLDGPVRPIARAMLVEMFDPLRRPPGRA